MSTVGQRERRTQDRIVRFLTDPAGPMRYQYLGNWEARGENANVEEENLAAWLTKQGHDATIVTKVLHELGKAKPLGGSKTLYDANREVYGLLRYGVKVSPDAGERKVTVWLIDWKHPENNDFAIAEEVTVAGVHDKRPDIVLYVNGIALGVLELKRSTVSVTEGIRQNFDSQKPEFIRPFFSTVQLLLAGNDTEGVRYGVIETPEKYYLHWKEAGDGSLPASPLEAGLVCLWKPDRLLEIVHDFIVFDAGIKKTCRHNQYFGIRAAQAAVRKREGGVIWHTQGSGKIVTSYKPMASDIKGQDSGEGKNEKLRQYDIYRKMLAQHFNEPEDTAAAKVELFEKEVKKRFIDQPGQMKLLIVVDKLLTGFDAPPATYLYIDKQMRDHGLFQAICRVNRLDGEDKEYGYIIDYKDLFKSLEKSIKDYTGEAFDQFDAEDVADLLKDRLEKGRERLEEVREAIKALCEAVEPPRDTRAYLRYFVTSDSADGEQIEENEAKRVALYKLAAAFLRAYANLANEMVQAGYTETEAKAVKDEVGHYEKVREEVKLASGDYIDMKMYEPAMRHLLDTYIRAEDSQKVSAFDDLTLVQLIVERGEAAMESLPDGIRESKEAMAETIENNVRRVIIDEMAVNPKYYEKMSELLDALIQQRKQDAIDYKEYLKRIVALTKQVKAPETQASYPSTVNTPARRAMYDNLGQNAEVAVRLDEAILNVKKADWRGNKFKEKEVRTAIKAVLGSDDGQIERIFEIVKSQRDY
ncbi:MAG: type I restriction endonuclease subunit R [Candidatus Eisenbacteria bacterium]|nr:type I restriction endonuclease subunit R [Candidatus Eisenbacteria bacterium]